MHALFDALGGSLRDAQQLDAKAEFAGRCYVEMPKDSATLRAVAERLMEIAARKKEEGT